MPAIIPTVQNGASCHVLYNGACGVVGVAQDVEFDITALPDAVRADADFRDNFRVIVRQVSVNGVTDVDPAVDFLPATGTVESFVLTVTSEAAPDTLNLEAYLIHSVVR